jgi:hypothetical protein
MKDASGYVHGSGDRRRRCYDRRQLGFRGGGGKKQGYYPRRRPRLEEGDGPKAHEAEERGF